MNHFKIFRDLNGTHKCDMCGENHVSVAKLAVNGLVVHPWRICQGCMESTAQLMKLGFDSNENLDAAMKMQL